MEGTSESSQSRVALNPDLKSPRAQEFESKLGALIVGQDRAVRRISGLYQIYLAGMQNPGRPIGTMLFLGPTGSGKTRVVEAAAEVLFDDSNAVVKIDCDEHPGYEEKKEVHEVSFKLEGTSVAPGR